MPTLTPVDLLAQLNWRYAVKEFDPARLLSTEEWNVLEESLVLAPSSFGLQPWEFIVITNAGLRSALLEASWKQRQVIDCSHYVVFAAPTNLGDDAVDAFAARTAEVRKLPPESMEGFRKMVKSFLANFDESGRLNWAIRQVYIALGQLMTSAAVVGVDTCPMEGFSPPDYDRILGLADRNLTAAVACAVGHRTGSDKYATLPKVRYDRSQVIETRA